MHLIRIEITSANTFNSNLLLPADVCAAPNHKVFVINFIMMIHLDVCADGEPSSRPARVEPTYIEGIIYLPLYAECNTPLA